MQIDLKLVRTFCAIYEARSVSRAAELLSLTQPAVSHALAQLRHQMGDALFVRARNGVTPTALADRIYRSLGHGLEIIDGAFGAEIAFDPFISNRRFRFALSDIGEMVYLPALLGVLHRQAPGIRIETVQPQLGETARALEIGRIDFAIGYLPALAAETVSAPLFSESYVCLLRKKHRTIGQKLSLAEFEAASHIVVDTPFTQHYAFVNALAEMARRREVLRVLHFTSVPAIVARSDLLAVLPLRVARIFAQTHRLRTLPLPFDIPRFEVRLHWHRRAETDRGHNWMRELLKKHLSVL